MEKSIGSCDPNFNLDTKSKDKMEEFGKQMKRKGVSHIYFVHGTWAGESPLGFLSRISSNPLKSLVGDLVKITVDKTMGDLGNYTASYCDKFHKEIGGGIPCDRVNWGSGNFHRARVKGTITLIKEVAKGINNPSDNERILLIGHSHAGQLFALLTTFLEDEEMSMMETNENNSKMEQLVEEVGLDEDTYKDITQLKEDLRKIDKVFLDIVTFGTPPRYQWGNTKRRGEKTNYRLLNIINHHKDQRKVYITGVLTTEDGDYVQQWGVGGTDLDDSKNSAIEEIIGEEQYYFDFDSYMLKGTERHIPKYGEIKYGKTLLKDYGDEGGNPIETLLGHGIYTCKEKMLFNTDLIVDNFYKD